MDSGRASTSAPPRDIQFNCQHCAGALIVDSAAAGMTLPCERCGEPTHLPTANRPASASKAPNHLEHKLKENESQLTEVTSYINQLSIQLHHWQLRLQTLNERKAELEAELTSSAD